MNQLFASKAVRLWALSAVCTCMAACGGGVFNDPPGIATSSIASTQNPLVAQFTMVTALGCQGQVGVEFGPDTSYGRNTAWYPASAGRQTSTILVAGMMASTTYHMRAQAQCLGTTTAFDGPDQTFATGPLPSIAFPQLTVTRPNPSLSSTENPGIEMITVTTASTPAFFTDRDANPIWYYDVGVGNYAFPFKLLPTGHMILNVANTTDSTLREVDLAGNTIRELDISALQQAAQTAGYD